MKKSIFIALILLIQNATCIFANVPDMEFFLPTEYQLISELDEKDAQSFVKNKKDFIEKCEFLNFFEKMAIINGYAANKNLYKANNSVKEISTYSVTFLIETDFEISEEWKKTKSLLCESDNMNYQVFDFSEPFYSVTVDSFYKGTKYNDTCLAELNLFCNGEWLFGDIEEK